MRSQQWKDTRPYFYPRPPRGGRRAKRWSACGLYGISTHALREEGDLSGSCTLDCNTQISTHALREEGDHGFGGHHVGRLYISTHALREEGDVICPTYSRYGQISTHALREEGDFQKMMKDAEAGISTHALREEGDLVLGVDVADALLISTHALREEGDKRWLPGPASCSNFYPRPPRGGRRGGGTAWLQ